VPVGVSVEENPMLRSTAARLATGPAKVTVTAAATPTTSPGPGEMFATGVGCGTAETPIPVEAPSSRVAVPATASTRDSAVRKFILRCLVGNYMLDRNPRIKR
jgi:hypothetical protein